MTVIRTSADMFDSHLLIPNDPDYVPPSNRVLRFFQHLIETGVLSSPVGIQLRKPTDEDMFGRNPVTGEKILIGKRLEDVPVSEFAAIETNILGSDEYILRLRSTVPVSSTPFELYERDGTRADSAKTYRLEVVCRLRNHRTQLSESWHEHLRTFLLPLEKAANACPRCGAIHTPEEEVQPRFWIDFLFGRLYVSDLKMSSYPIQPRLLADTESFFGTTFFHGRFFD
jgi:hypothetical protein